MKGYKAILFLLLTVATSSCMEDFDQRYLFDKMCFIEFQEATIKGKELGKQYVTSSQILSPQNKKVRVQVNLVGKPRDEKTVIKYRVDDILSSAVKKRDYSIENFGELSFEAGKNIAYIEIEATEVGEGNTLLVLQLVGNDLVNPSENYKYIAIKCQYL